MGSADVAPHIQPLCTPVNGHRGGGSGLVFRLVFKTSAPG